MSLQTVQDFLARHSPEARVIVTADSSATVALAAVAFGVEPARITKTLCLRADVRTILVVASGTARLDNRKFRARFGDKPRMLGPEEVLAATEHPVGGVCPFGLPGPLPVFCDLSLRGFATVVPAAGATNKAVRLTPDRLAEITGAEWVDLCG